jgi:hypothetical protein
VGRVRPAGRAGTSAALFVPNVKVRVKAKDFFPLRKVISAAE